MRKYFILFIISILPYAAFADAVQIGSLWYILDESAMTAEVTSSGGDSYSGDIVIPGSVTYGDVTYSVKSIGVRAFNDIPLTSVTIEDGIETIKEYAFWDSDGINELVLPKTLKVIGDEAFTWAYITSLVLPEGLDSIGRNAFTSCNRLKNLEIPSTLTRIGDNAFSSCGNISSIVSRIQTPFSISESVICIDSTIKNKSLKVGLLSIPAAFVQLMGYGFGFIESWWKRCVLRQDEFTAFERTFYK